MRCALPLLAALLLGGCSAAATRLDVAAAIATPSHFVPEQIEASPFLITTYVRMTTPNRPATVYIEGDGLAWIGRTEKSLDPSPTNPTALRLATFDPSANVIYLARPCQYTKMLKKDQACPDDYWTGKRFAPEVIAAMDRVLNTLKDKYRPAGYNLVGYSGGGGVAVLLAARRHDVLSLRTVAGNLDHVALSTGHNVSPMEGSLNPKDAARSIAGLPQRHFIGGSDTVVTPDIYQSYQAAMGSIRCSKSETVPGVTHERGWVEHWPSLLEEPVKCDGIQ